MDAQGSMKDKNKLWVFYRYYCRFLIANYRTFLLALRGYSLKKITRMEALKLIYYDVFIPNMIGYGCSMFCLSVIFDFLGII